MSHSVLGRKLHQTLSSLGSPIHIKDTKLPFLSQEKILTKENMSPLIHMEMFLMVLIPVSWD